GPERRGKEGGEEGRARAHGTEGPAEGSGERSGRGSTSRSLDAQAGARARTETARPRAHGCPADGPGTRQAGHGDSGAPRRRAPLEGCRKGAAARRRAPADRGSEAE